MSHAPQGGQDPDQAGSGRQAGAAAHTQTDHSQGTHTAASPLTSHTRHGTEPGWQRTQTDQPVESHSHLNETDHTIECWHVVAAN